MFKLVYAKGTKKDLKNIPKKSLSKIKIAIEGLTEFPAITSIKHLTNHPIANYRLRVGNYRVLFDADWKNKKIYILKIAHRSKIYIKF